MIGPINMITDKGHLLGIREIKNKQTNKQTNKYLII